jgi:hypothetical protein
MTTGAMATANASRVFAFPYSAHHSGNCVAVIIVNYNAGGDLARCLAGLRGQTRRPERCIVIDNGSDQQPSTNTLK